MIYDYYYLYYIYLTNYIFIYNMLRFEWNANAISFMCDDWLEKDFKHFHFNFVKCINQQPRTWLFESKWNRLQHPCGGNTLKFVQNFLYRVRSYCEMKNVDDVMTMFCSNNNNSLCNNELENDFKPALLMV